MRFRFVVYTN